MAWYWGWILPTDALALVLMSIIGVVAMVMLGLDLFSSNQKKTEEEMVEIKSSIIDYYKEVEHFPKSLDDIIKNNPLKRTWIKDYWGTNYKLQMVDEKKIRLISAGVDRTFESNDDIVVQIPAR